MTVFCQSGMMMMMYEYVRKHTLTFAEGLTRTGSRWGQWNCDMIIIFLFPFTVLNCFNILFFLHAFWWVPESDLKILFKGKWLNRVFPKENSNLYDFSNLTDKFSKLGLIKFRKENNHEWTTPEPKSTNWRSGDFNLCMCYISLHNRIWTISFLLSSVAVVSSQMALQLR